MTEDRNRFRLRKQVLTLLHVMFVLIAVAGISAMYLNANYGKGIKWIYNEAYEDSDSFCSQLQNDISKLFTYVGYRDMFETNGKLDMHKPIVVYTDGPGAQKQTYTLDQIVRYAKTRGYYLDDNFMLTGSPISMEEDDDSDKELTIDYQAYNPEFINGDGIPVRMTKEDLALDILEHLGEYYSIYYNYVEKQTNLQFRIVYTTDQGTEKIYTNVPDKTKEEIMQSGKYLYVPGNSIKMESNLAVIPVDVASYLEIWNPGDNDRYYLAVEVDTSYPNTDSYSMEAAEYREDRSNFITGMAGAAAGSAGELLTLVFLVILSGYVQEGITDIRLFPLGGTYKEGFLPLWVAAAAVGLFAGRAGGNVPRVGAFAVGAALPDGNRAGSALLPRQEIAGLHVRGGQGKGQGIFLKGLPHGAGVLRAGEAHMPADGHGLLPGEAQEAGEDVDALLPVAVGQGSS